MASEDDLETFIAGDIPGRVNAYAITPDAVTIGQSYSNLGDPDEVLVRHVTGHDVQRDQGKFRHFFEVRLNRKHLDHLDNEESAKELRTAAKELEDGWDGGLALFQAGAPNVLISRVRAYRPNPKEVTVQGYDISLSVFVEIDEFEE